MHKVNDINKYKKAIAYEKDFVKIADIMNKTLGQLQPYIKYIPVAEAFRTLHDNVKVIEIHLEHQRKIKESKGSSNDDI